jgi:Carboxypeptidase regulatory-like domain
LRIRLVSAGIVSTALFFAIIGCSKKEPDAAAQPPPTAVVDTATTGSMTGTVKLDGRPTEFRAIDMSAEPACVQVNPTPVVPAIIVVGAEGALANVVVYVKSGLGRYHYDVPTAPTILTQKGCMYVPRVLATMANQPFEVWNEDQTVHNVHPIPRENRGWNKSEPIGGEPIDSTFPLPEIAIPIACNIHPWMRAFLFVFDHPYFDITAKSGKFELKNLPPGTYTIEAWQEKYGTQDQTVTLAPKETKTLAFTFKSGR